MKNPKEEAKQRAANYMSLKGALDSQYVDFSNPNTDKITSASTTTIKEEPKQIKCYCGHTTYCDCGPLEEPKQETLEEIELAILFHNTYERLAPSFGYETRVDTKLFETTTPNGKLMIAVCKEIIKHQQERSYSEEEVIVLLQKYRLDLSSGKTPNLGDTTKQWLEQFKKK
jgi:hypothetical protein